jgi:hypothetical protein
MIVSVKHNLIYSIIIIKLATCFDHIGSSSSLHYEPINVKKTAYIFGIPIVFTKDEKIGHEHFTLIFINIIGITEMYEVF